MPTDHVVTDRNSIKLRLMALLGTPMTYREVALEIDAKGRISSAMIWRIIKQDYEPKDPTIRKLLGFPEIITLKRYRNKDGTFS